MGNSQPLAKGVAAHRAHIAARDLACARGDSLLFRGLNFSCEAGSALHVTGANGTGKSSLLRLLAGLLRPFSGAVEVTGKLALTDERPALDTHETLERALGFWTRLGGSEPDRTAQALDALDLRELADVPLAYFSTGQRKRAGLARVMASDAPIWLLDEPANGLDTQSLDRLGHIMHDHLHGGGIVIAASHQPLPLDHAITLPLAEFRA